MSRDERGPETGRAGPVRPVAEVDIYRELARMSEEGEYGTLATVIATRLSTPRHAGAKMIVHADGSLTGTVGGGAAESLVIERAAEVLQSGECQTVSLDLTGEHGVCGGRMEVFLEPVQRAPAFFVVGAGHVGRAMAQLGRSLGFRVALIDDRPDFLEEFEARLGVRTIVAGPAALEAQVRVPPGAAVLVCSRNHRLDAGYLEALLRLEMSGGREFVFFGALGSQSKAAHLRAALGAMPELAARLAEVRLPVGIELGAETPAEIALSVYAEALAVLRQVPLATTTDGRWAYRLRGSRP